MELFYKYKYEDRINEFQHNQSMKLILYRLILKHLFNCHYCDSCKVDPIDCSWKSMLSRMFADYLTSMFMKGVGVYYIEEYATTIVLTLPEDQSSSSSAEG